ncbi:vascular non-inflammatory molecule 3-like [Watersipora subatra]|uniref:vascular non-inflammatory molecule 3-like n=1 Tax=Watersipora subatra TaxID=2589382 RepID=UPI00355B2601
MYDLVLQIGLVCSIVSFCLATNTFTAAVYEHAIRSGKVESRSDALRIINKNLMVFTQQVAAAKMQGVDILAFPEYGLTGSITKYNPVLRSSAYLYAEKAPEPSSSEACMACGPYPSNSDDWTVNHLCCLAQTNQMYLVANLIEKQLTVNGSNLKLYNTNIIINSSGCIVSKYHKYHLYGDESKLLDQPDHVEYSYTDTPFGRMGTLICYDLTFEEPALSLINTYQVDTLILSTYWTLVYRSTALYENIVEYASGWSRRMNVNFLAANIRDLKQHSFGSVISSPEDIVDVYYQPHLTSGQLLVANLNKSSRHQVVSNDLSSPEPARAVEWSELEHEGGVTYQVAQLKNLADDIKVCHGTLCCSVSYRMNLTEDYIVLAAHQSYSSSPYLEVCLLQTCKNESKSSCLDFPISNGTTTFNYFVLSGNFSSAYAFPTVSGSGYSFIDITWQFSYDNHTNEIIVGEMSYPFLNAAIYTYFQ